jgi:hypothetical protein
MWDFVVEKVAPGQDSPTNFMPPSAPKKIIFIIIIINRGYVQ